LVAFKEANGHCNVPQESGPLGSWCCNQRQRRDTLSPEQLAKLNAIGFPWNPPRYPQHDEFWDEMFAKLVSFKEANGHCNVTRSMDSALGSWCDNQRYRRKHNQLSEERIAQLDTLGDFFGGVVGSRWDKKYAELMAFKKTNGHC